MVWEYKREEGSGEDSVAGTGNSGLPVVRVRLKETGFALLKEKRNI